MSLTKTVHYNSSPALRVGRELGYRGAPHRFTVVGSRYIHGETEFGSISMDRKEALALRRELNTMLRATQPARKR